MPNFDVFHRSNKTDDEWHWLEGTVTLEGAKTRVNELAAREGGDFLICDQGNRQKILINIRPCFAPKSE